MAEKRPSSSSCGVETAGQWDGRAGMVELSSSEV